MIFLIAVYFRLFFIFLKGKCVNVLIKGRVANSYQIIGVFAAKEYLSDKYNASVTLNVSYAQYWKKKNIPSELESILDFIEQKKKYDRVYDIKVNHNYRIFSDSVITVDDGVGAYRKDFFKSFKTINKENKYNNKQAIDFTSCFKALAMYFVAQTASLYPKNHISIFKKSLFNYFEINKDNVNYFKKAISSLVNETGLEIQLTSNSIVYLTQPASLIWNSDIKYKKHLESFLEILKYKYNGSKVYFKLHPMDDFDYSSYDVDIISSDIPAEFIFSSNYRNIKAVLGVNSTSMLTAKVIYNIDAYSIDSESISKLDFWARKAFLKYAPVLSMRSI